MGSSISYDNKSLLGIERYSKSDKYIFTIKLPKYPRQEVEVIDKSGNSTVIKLEDAYLCYNFKSKDIKYIPFIASALNSLMKMIGENIKCKYSSYQLIFKTKNGSHILKKLKELFHLQSDNTHYYFTVLSNTSNCCWRDINKITLKQSPNDKKYVFIGAVYDEHMNNSTTQYFDIFDLPPLPIINEFTD